jgi:hypothetical protein
MVNAGDKSYFRFTDEAGREVGIVAARRDGGTVRVAVGEVGHRSSIWRIWANKGSSDIYVAAGNIAGIQKYSLHQSGRWRYAFTAQAADDWIAEGDDRAIDKWERPSEDEAGWIAAVRIAVRSEDVSEVPNDDTSEGKVSWVPAPPEGHVASIMITLVTPDTGVEGQIPGKLLDAFVLPNGGGVMISTITSVVTASDQRALDAAREAALHSFELPQGEVPALRLGVFGYDRSTGLRWVYDTAVRGDEALAPPPDAV